MGRPPTLGWVKNDMVRIRCDERTKKRFKEFVTGSGFHDAEEAILYMLDVVEARAAEKE